MDPMGFPNFPSNIQAPPPPMGGHHPPPPEVASKANQSYTWAMAGRDGRKLFAPRLMQNPWAKGPP